MMASLSSPNNKRQKHDNNTTQMRLIDFPDEQLITVASYLPQSSCVSYALAITNDSTSQPSELCMAIATASKENSIDFKDIQGVLGRRLMDYDVRWVLTCIDAVHKVESVKLTNCLGVTGVGLEPLRGSIVLKRIDLSLVGEYENPTIEPEPPISVSNIVPILESIICAKGNQLVHIQLPKNWRVEKSYTLSRFLRRFDEVLKRRRFECTKMTARALYNTACEEEVCGVGGDRDGNYSLVEWQEGVAFYGMLSFTCYACEKNICLSCNHDWCHIEFCSYCEKFYCKDCNEVYYCEGGNCPSSYQPSRVDTFHQDTSCRVCNIVKECTNCELPFCSACEPSWVTCQYCDKVSCNRCEWDCMSVCGGEGCNRINCIGCTDGDIESQEYVELYWNEYDERTPFCRDCKPQDDVDSSSSSSSSSSS